MAHMRDPTFGRQPTSVALPAPARQNMTVYSNNNPDPQRDEKKDPLEPYGKSYKDNVIVVTGLYRGSNF